MKSFVAILLLFGLTFQCFSRLTVIAGFELNHRYIAEHLCVNRDNPSMHCDGQCFLDKKLQQDQQRKNQENENTGNRLVLSLFCPEEPYSYDTTLKSTTFVFDKIRSDHYRTPYFSFFHPPRFFS